MKISIKIILISCMYLFLFGACKDDAKEESIYDIPHSPNQSIVMDNIEPLSGGFGSRIVVTGNNFGNDKNKIKLYFNKKEALILNNPVNYQQ